MVEKVFAFVSLAFFGDAAFNRIDFGRWLAPFAFLFANGFGSLSVLDRLLREDDVV